GRLRRPAAGGPPARLTIGVAPAPALDVSTPRHRRRPRWRVFPKALTPRVVAPTGRGRAHADDCVARQSQDGVETMSGSSCASGGSGGRGPAMALWWCDPKARRIVAALQVLRELAETTVGSGDDASALVANIDADLFIAEEWVGTPGGRALLGWASQTRPSAVGILLASSRSGATTAHRDGLLVLPKLVDPGTLKTVCGLALDCAAL